MGKSTAADPWSVAAITAFAPDDRSLPAARDVLKKGGFGTVEATADGRGWWVVCQGITDTYQVSVRRNTGGEPFECECTCPSPKYPCKHALALLLYLSVHPELRVEKEEAPRAAGDFEPLVRAVFAAPDDDTPRLVFADFLDENGQPDRAALIRLQCEKRSVKPKSKQLGELTRAEGRLVGKLRARFVDPLPASYSAEFVRGFLRVHAFADYDLEDVNALPARFVELFRGGWVEAVFLDSYGHLNPAQLGLFRFAGELDVTKYPLREEGLLVLAAEAPVGRPDSRLARVKVHKTDEPVYRAFASDGAERLPRTPRLYGPQGPVRQYTSVTAAQLGLLIRAGRFDGVETLSLDGPIGDAGAELIAGTDDLRRLHALTLSRSGLTADGVAGLFAAGRFPALRQLTLLDALTGPQAFAALAEGSGLEQLTALQLHNEPIGDEGVRALAAATNFSQLETLRLFAVGATEASVAAVLASEPLDSLRELYLESDDIDPTAAVRLALGARDRRNLTVACWRLTAERTAAVGGGIRLSVQAEGSGSLDSVASAIRNSANAVRVAALELRQLGLTARAVPDLAAGLPPEELKELDLTGNRLGNDGAAALAEAFREFRPETLVLSRNGIRKTGAVTLAASPVLSAVKVFDLTHNNIGYNGVRAIAASPHLKSIKELRLQGTNLTLDEWKAIEQKFGKKVVV
jgi:uncharacterized protein (TIGR02996 family)